MPASTGVRLLLKFNFAQEIRPCGWSEGYDLGYADLPTAVAAINGINAFIQDRLALLGIGPYLAGATLSAYVQPVTPGAAPQRRPVLAIPVPPTPAEGVAYNTKLSASDPGSLADFSPTVMYVSCQTALSGSPVYRRNLWIAGLPDGSDQTNSNTVTLPAIVNIWDKFLNDLSNGATSTASRQGISIRSIDRSAGNPIKQCTGWNLVANTYTVPAHGFVLGQPILAEGMKTAPGGSCPRGRYLVSAVVDANTIALAGSLPPTAPTRLGGFRAAIVTFNQIAVATPEGFTKRNKGRLFFQSVGRRRRSLISRA